MNRTDAQTMISTLTLAEDQGRWSPRPSTRQAMNGLEQALAIRIQAGQPALEAMNESLMSTYADQVLADARADHAGCRIAAPTMDDVRLFGGTSVVMHDFTRKAVPAHARAA